MNFISVKEIAALVGLSKRTIEYKIAEVKKRKKFRKEYAGRFYTMAEARKLLRALKLPVSILTANTRNKPHKRLK